MEQEKQQVEQEVLMDKVLKTEACDLVERNLDIGCIFTEEEEKRLQKDAILAAESCK